MQFYDVVQARRSIRKFREAPVPEEVMERAFEAATLAPNSSNMQTWDFYWVRSPGPKARLVQLCLAQSAARTAAELVVVTADPYQWRRSNPLMLAYVEQIDAPEPVKQYYRHLIPLTYRWGLLNSWAIVKWLLTTLAGMVRPVPRGPSTRRDLQEVALKSAALAAENLVLALTAEGFATCMMEGFDEWRVKRLLKLRSSARVVMVIAVGQEAPNGTWGPSFRIPRELVVHRI